MHRRSAGHRQSSTAISSARCLLPLEAGDCFVDQKIGKALDVNRSHRELSNAGLGARNEAHATVSDHACRFCQTHHVPMHVGVHEDTGAGRTDSHLPRHRRETQNDFGRILQVSTDGCCCAILCLIRFH